MRVSSDRVPDDSQSVSVRRGTLRAARRVPLASDNEAAPFQSHDSAIVPRQRPHRTPLSYSQELLWLLDQLWPGRSVYNVPRIMRLRGPVNTEALQRALNSVVARHEV